MKVEKNTHPMNSKPYKVYVPHSHDGMWNWCCEHYAENSWHELFGLIGESVTFCFDTEEDAMFFVLRWAGDEK